MIHEMPKNAEPVQSQVSSRGRGMELWIVIFVNFSSWCLELVAWSLVPG